MTQAIPSQPGFADDDPDRLTPGVRIIQGDRSHALRIARRLVGQHLPNIDQVARNLVASAQSHNIDFSLAFASVLGTDDSAPIRQVALGVLGAGRTAMTFFSEPAPGGDPDGPDAARAERSACLRALCDHVHRSRAREAVIAQALPEPGHDWAVTPLIRSGFLSVGTLLYLRRQPGTLPEIRLPAGSGVHARAVADLPGRDRDRILIAALDASYEGTLDCPELCGLRSTRDILESHKATGSFDPTSWWVYVVDHQPLGCLLLSKSAEHGTIELVYMGLGVALRGRGLGKPLLVEGLRRICGRHPGFGVACAVDERNTPARRVYESLGFKAFARRQAWVRPLATPTT